MRRLVVLVITAVMAMTINSTQEEDETVVFDLADTIDSPELIIIKDPPHASVDIVAVHGMDGNWKRSWTASNGAFWLEEFLPRFVPQARIYSFSYDGRRRADEPLPFDIADHGRALISMLADERQLTHTTKRPLIFVGHSLGGIVIKSGLTYADNTRSGHLEHHKAIQLCTHAVIYMGTPHQGSDNIDLLRIIARLLDPVGYKNRLLLEHLRPHSQFLRDLQNNYLAISGAFETTFFYEMMPTSVGPGIKLMLVPEYSAVIPGAINSEAIPLRADHVKLVKYAHINDANMQRVGKKLSILAIRASEKIEQNSELVLTSHQNSDIPVARHVGQDSAPLEFRLGLAISQRRNSQFTGRESALSRISDTFLRTLKDQCNVLVLYGMGGIGKTQLALEYTYQAQGNFSSIFWIDGSSEQTALRSVREILKRLESHYKDNRIDKNSSHFDAIREALHPQDNANRLFKLVADAEATQNLERDAFRDWFSYSENRDWLLIMDNVDDLESFDFNQLLPARGGSVLMTSRRPDLTVNLRSIEVTEMDEEEALHLLESTAGFHLEPESLDFKEAKQLNSLLGYFPLAITQAGSYLKVNQGSIRSYLDLYHEHPARLLNHRLAGFAWNYRNDTVLTTWEISYQAIRRQSPGAIQLLHRCGFLSRESIEDEILKLWSGPLGLGYRDQSTEVELDQSINLLVSYSFLRRYGKSMSMHPLVHLWARERLLAPEKEALAREVLELLYRASISDDEPVGIGGHVNSIANFYLSYYRCDKSPENFVDIVVYQHDSSWASLLRQEVEATYGWYLLITGKLEEWSTYLYRQWTGTMVSGLADWELLYRLRGYIFQDRNTILSWALCRAMSTLPPKHIRVLVVIGDYAMSLGGGESSLAWYTWLYSARKQVLGKEHSATMGAMMGMGLFSRYCHQCLGYLRIAAETREKTEGLDDLLTQNAISFLQEYFDDCSENERHATEAVEWNLRAFQRNLGPGWPADVVVSSIHASDLMVVKMADSALNTSLNTTRILLEVILSRPLKSLDTLEGLSAAILFILRHYNALYLSPQDGKRLALLVQARWNDAQSILESYWDASKDQFPLRSQFFSTCLHTRLGLLMVLIHGLTRDTLSAQAWSKRIVYPGKDSRPNHQVKYFTGCGSDMVEPEPPSAIYFLALLKDIMKLLRDIHGKGEARNIFNPVVEWVAAEFIIRDLQSYDDSAAPIAWYLQGYKSVCASQWVVESSETYHKWGESAGVCPGAFLLEEAGEIVDEDRSAACFVDTRQFYMCHPSV